MIYAFPNGKKVFSRKFFFRRCSLTQLFCCCRTMDIYLAPFFGNHAPLPHSLHGEGVHLKAISIIAHFKQNFYSGPNNLAGAFLWNIHFLRGIAPLRNCFIKAHAKCKTSLYVLMEIGLPLSR